MFFYSTRFIASITRTMRRRQKGRGFGSFLRKLGKKHGKRLGRYALNRAKAIGRAEARRVASHVLTATRPQRGGVFRGRTRQRGKKSQGGGGWGALAKVGLNILNSL